MSDIWNAASILRGKVNAYEYKDYILSLIFYKFLCDRYERCINENPSSPCREDETLNRLGYYIPSQSNYYHLLTMAKNGGVTYRNVLTALRSIALTAIGRESEPFFRDLFVLPKIGDEVMTDLIIAVDEFDKGDKEDIIGDRYMKLIDLFSSSAGRKDGEFYTPAGLCDLVSEIVHLYFGGRTIESISDPSCGSGALLLSVCKRNHVKRIHGRDVNESAYKMSKMNTLIHGLGYRNTNFELGDTLTCEDQEKYQVMVTNPPFSLRWKPYPSCKYPILAPQKYADMAFIENLIYHMEELSVAILPLGVLYRNGTEKEIRQWMINQNLIETVIKLPQDLFYGTAIPTCCIVLRKNRPDSKVLFIDATDEYVKNKKQRILSQDNINKIIGVCRKREDLHGFSKLLESKAIKDANLNISIKKAESYSCQYSIKELNSLISNVQEEINALEDKIRIELDSQLPTS